MKYGHNYASMFPCYAVLGNGYDVWELVILHGFGRVKLIKRISIEIKLKNDKKVDEHDRISSYYSARDVLSKKKLSLEHKEGTKK